MTELTPIDRHRARRIRYRNYLPQTAIADHVDRSKSWVSNAERGVFDYNIPTHTLPTLAETLALTDPDWLKPGSYPHDQLTAWIGAHVEATIKNRRFTGTVADVEGGFFYVVPDDERLGLPASWRVRYGEDMVAIVPACNVARRPEAWPAGGAGG